MRGFFEKILVCSALIMGVASPALAYDMRVAVLGDSLLSGYQVQSSEAYANKLYYKLKDVGYTSVEVVSMGAPGLTTSAAAESVREVIARRPDVVVVQLGSNDALRGVNADLIYQNMVDILGKLQQNRIYIVLMGVKAPEGADPAYARQLDAVFERLVKFYRVPFYPDTLAGISGNQSLSLADGYHPNGKGIDWIVENTYRMVDAGLRWKWEYLNETSNYQDQTGQAMPPAMAWPVDPPPVSGAR